MRRVFLVCVLWLGWCIVSWGQTPAGLWRTIDDETGKERSLIRVSELAGEWQGVVEKIFPQPGDDPAHLCRRCEGELKDKPVIGMRVMWGLKKRSEVKYDGGTIMDPNNGKTYRCKLSVLEQGRKLEVRGYIGISLLGRSQVWLREE